MSAERLENLQPGQGEAERIKGLRSNAIAAALGYTSGPTLIHADDLALTRR